CQPGLIISQRLFQVSARGQYVPTLLPPALEAFAHDLLKVIVSRETLFRLRNRILRQVVDVLRQPQLAAFGDLDCASKNLRKFVAEDTPHLFTRPHVKIRTRVTQSFGIVDSLARADTEQDVVSSSVFRR